MAHVCVTSPNKDEVKYAILGAILYARLLTDKLVDHLMNAMIKWVASISQLTPQVSLTYV